MRLTALPATYLVHIILQHSPSQVCVCSIVWLVIFEGTKLCAMMLMALLIVGVLFHVELRPVHRYSGMHRTVKFAGSFFHATQMTHENYQPYGIRNVLVVFGVSVTNDQPYAMIVAHRPQYLLPTLY